MDWIETKAFLTPCFPEEVREELDMLMAGELREIRVRANRPTVFVTAARSAALAWTPDEREVEQLAEALSGHGLYARASEMRRGFVTLRGGHRMGLCGQVAREDDEITALRGIGSLCIRIAGEWPGCADGLVPWVRQKGSLRSLLIVGLPGTGKTTLLRDLARQLGSGRNAVSLSVVDERGELAACVNGVPQLDVGETTDVLDGCPRGEAVAWLLRAMSPQGMITDEIANATDANAILDAVYSGVPVLASAHGTGLHDLAQRPVMASLMARRIFDYYAVLDPKGNGQIASVYDRMGSVVTKL